MPHELFHSLSVALKARLPTLLVLWAVVFIGLACLDVVAYGRFALTAWAR